MAANQKIERLAAAVQDSLTARLPAVAISKSYDGNGDAVITVGTAALIRFVKEAAPASGLTDGLGLTQNVYTPHIAQVLFAAAAVDATKLPVLCEIAKLGTKVEFYVNASLVVGSIASGNLIGTYADLFWGTNSQQ